MSFYQRNSLQGRMFENRFDLKEQIGNGRMSSVYRAMDTVSGNIPVAVKILNTDHPDETKRALFTRETTALKTTPTPECRESVAMRVVGYGELLLPGAAVPA